MLQLLKTQEGSALLQKIQLTKAHSKQVPEACNASSSLDHGSLPPCAMQNAPANSQEQLAARTLPNLT